ncbi:TetR family transcriptional regulator C-terminal domain-containing protein [Pedobacter sp. SYP-B3415]|uniref:TetR family transcriptional regulator C-terminal domain-containing protein n=1 Tax=Pedobacter sp. SYP-B3415 TaxID=2496641 RepID=UPI00101BC5D7|nr:TetR family transcriptional regulator C-terminal domain-containing protein [Pedobacter sp. SYP-B3415]
MATATQIQKAYIDYVLSNGESPKSVYVFTKRLKIAEEEFYLHFGSFTSIEKSFWADAVSTVVSSIRQQEVWPSFSAREKVLSFFYGFTEYLLRHRSFAVHTLRQHMRGLSAPPVLDDAKPVFEAFAESVIAEGLESGELAERRFFSKRYKDALWVQFLFIMRFWANDTSAAFSKTDEAIEKGITVTFDLFQHSPLDNLLDYGKFLSRNGRFV